MGFLDKFLAPFVTLLKYPVESYIRLETSQDETTLLAEDASLITMIKVEGSRQIIGEQEYRFLLESSTLKLGARFDRSGHAWQVYFARNPDRASESVETMMQPNRLAAKNMGLELDDLFDERVRHLSRFLSWEECYFVLWTRPSVLPKSELKKAVEENKKRKWVPSFNAQHPVHSYEALKSRHKSYVAGMRSALDEMGIRCTVMEVHDALRAVRSNLFPSRANQKWEPCLPGDPIPVRAPQSTKDYSDILWPTLRQQITTDHAIKLSETSVRIGNQVWAGCDMVLAPMDPAPFPMLMNRLFEADVPFRISFLIESGGAHGAQTKASVASILGFSNSQNRQIKNSIEKLQAIARSEPVVRLRISLATWGNHDEEKLVEERLSILMQAVEAWGYAQVSAVVGDPLDAVMSSALGIACASTAPAAIAPMYEVMKMLPWQRPSSPFDKGSVMLRTPDGKIWPYQTGSALTTTWFDLIFAQPGAGKSVLLNSLNLGTCLDAGLSSLPYIATVDIGPSSSGLISLIKEALPPERRHEASYYKLQMSNQYAVNPFDTQLGCRYPLMDERSYLVELMTLLCTPAGQKKPYDGIQQLSGLVVDEMFRWRDDSAANSEPRPYLPRMDNEVDEGLKTYNVHLPSDPYWWDVVDKFFELEQYHLANLAQRHAVPVLGDAITAARRPQIRTLLEQTQVGGSAETVINAFERMITSAIREYPILAAVTRFEIIGTRVCSLDLQDVAPQGDEMADRQTSIMYMLARHVLVRSWWLGKESIEHMPEKYRQYHHDRLSDISEASKRLCYDEFHRTAKSSSVRGQIIRDVREGRKRKVQIVLASQLIDDFDDDMVDLATGVWVLGTAISDGAVNRAQSRFGLSNTARNVIRFQLTGPRSSGAPALFVLGTKNGRYEQHLINTLGPIELWALSTSTDDVTIRSKLYTKLGAQRARQVLAMAYPGGSASSEIKRRVYAKAEKGDTQGAATSAVIEEIVQELEDLSQRRTYFG